MASPQDLLDAVNAEILDRLNNGAFEEYSEGQQRFRSMSLKDLRDFRAELMAEIATGSTFSSIVPVQTHESGGPGLGPYCY